MILIWASSVGMCRNVSRNLNLVIERRTVEETPPAPTSAQFYILFILPLICSYTFHCSCYPQGAYISVIKMYCNKIVLCVKLFYFSMFILTIHIIIFIHIIYIFIY